MSQNAAPGDESSPNSMSDTPAQESHAKEQPNIIETTKEFIRKTSRSSSKKEDLMELLAKHDSGEFNDQDFFNKVHVLDISLTTKAYHKVRELKENNKNPSKNPNSLSPPKRSSATKPKQTGHSSNQSPTKIADEAKSPHQKSSKEIQSNLGDSHESDGVQNNNGEPSLMTDNNGDYHHNHSNGILDEDHHSQDNSSVQRNENGQTMKSDSKKRVNKSERKSVVKNLQDEMEKRSNLSTEQKKGSSGRMSTRHGGVKTTNYREMQKGTQSMKQHSENGPYKRAKTQQTEIRQETEIHSCSDGQRRPSQEESRIDENEEQGEDEINEVGEAESGEQEADEEIHSEREQTGQIIVSQNGERDATQSNQFGMKLSDDGDQQNEETDLMQSLPRKIDKPISSVRQSNLKPVNGLSKNELNPYQMVLDRKHLRNQIKQKLQINGFYNFKKQSREQIAISVDETERLMHEVVKAQLKNTIQDLVNIQRSRFQQWKIHQHTLPAETTTYEYVSQMEQMKHNWSFQENQNGYGGPINNAHPPQKESLDMVTVENIQSYQRILENEEKKRNILQEEQRQIRDRAQRLASQQAQNDKSEANTAEKKVEEDSDIMIDPDTGKKMTKKKIKEMHQAGTLTQKQIAEFQSKGLLQPSSTADSNLQQSRRQQELQQLQGTGKQNDLGYHMLKVQNRQGKLDQSVTIDQDLCEQNPEKQLLQDFVKVGAGPRLNLQVLESKGDFEKNDTSSIIQKCDMAAEYLKNASQYIQEQQNRPGQPYHPMQFREAQDQVESLGKDLAMPKDLQQKVQMRDVVVYLNSQIQKGTESKSQSNSLREILYEILNSSKYV